MREKYKHLNDLSKAIKSFKLRFKKEYPKAHMGYAIRYINELNLSDDILNEIIQLIKDEGKMTLKEIIDDVNISIKEENWWRDRDDKVKCVRNKSGLIKYIKTYYSNYPILTNVVNCLFSYTSSKKGYDFYVLLDMKVKKTLKVFKLK